MARELKNVENETQTLFDLEYGMKHSKMWKMRSTQCRTWIMARELKNVENKKFTFQDMEYGKKTENHGK